MSEKTAEEADAPLCCECWRRIDGNGVTVNYRYGVSIIERVISRGRQGRSLVRMGNGLNLPPLMLIVDDDPMTRLLFPRALERTGTPQ